MTAIPRSCTYCKDCLWSMPFLCYKFATCNNNRSDHFAHVFTDEHVACGEFREKK